MQPEAVIDPEVAAMPPPPDGFDVNFLLWLRQATERAWAVMDDPTAAVLGARWCRGTRWTGGLDEATIEGIERRYGIRFPREYRMFPTNAAQHDAAVPRLQICRPRRPHRVRSTMVL